MCQSGLYYLTIKTRCRELGVVLRRLPYLSSLNCELIRLRCRRTCHCSLVLLPLTVVDVKYYCVKYAVKRYFMCIPLWIIRSSLVVAHILQNIIFTSTDLWTLQRNPKTVSQIDETGKN